MSALTIGFERQFCAGICNSPILAGLVVIAVSSPPSSSLWKCGKPRLVRVSKLGGTGNNLRPRFRYRSHRASFPQRTRNSAHFGANVVVGGCTRPKCPFPETRAERTLLQIVVQSHFADGRRKCGSTHLLHLPEIQSGL